MTKSKVAKVVTRLPENGVLKIDPRNVRLHGRENKKRIKQSLEAIGAGRGILADGENIIRAGNGIYEQAKKLGFKFKIVDVDDKTILVSRRPDLRGKRAVRAAMLDNLASDSSAYDYDADILADVVNNDALLKSIAADDERLQELLGIKDETPNDDEHAAKLMDKATELQKKWKVKTGDVWQVGKHKLLCGDSTDEKISERFGKKVDGICTDPPYDLSAEQIIKSCANFADVAIILSSDRLAFDLAKLWRMSHDFIWKRRQPRSFPTEHLPVLYHNHCVVLTRSKNKCEWKRPQPGFGSVIELEGNEFEDTEMGHGKNAKLFEEMLAGFAWKRVGEPFAGTGATIIACENIKRQCFAVELNPITCAVALERWTRNFPAQEPRRL